MNSKEDEEARRREIKLRERELEVLAKQLQMLKNRSSSGDHTAQEHHPEREKMATEQEEQAPAWSPIQSEGERDDEYSSNERGRLMIDIREEEPEANQQEQQRADTEKLAESPQQDRLASEGSDTGLEAENSQENQPADQAVEAIAELERERNPIEGEESSNEVAEADDQDLQRAGLEPEMERWQSEPSSSQHKGQQEQLSVKQRDARYRKERKSLRIREEKQWRARNFWASGLSRAQQNKSKENGKLQKEAIWAKITKIKVQRGWQTAKQDESEQKRQTRPGTRAAQPKEATSKGERYLTVTLQRLDRPGEQEQQQQEARANRVARPHKLLKIERDSTGRNKKKKIKKQDVDVRREWRNQQKRDTWNENKERYNKAKREKRQQRKAKGKSKVSKNKKRWESSESEE